jgi:hypothetical protein
MKNIELITKGKKGSVGVYRYAISLGRLPANDYSSTERILDHTAIFKAKNIDPKILSIAVTPTFGAFDQEYLVDASMRALDLYPAHNNFELIWEAAGMGYILRDYNIRQARREQNIVAFIAPRWDVCELKSLGSNDDAVFVERALFLSINNIAQPIVRSVASAA